MPAANATSSAATNAARRSGGSPIIAAAAVAPAKANAAHSHPTSLRAPNGIRTASKAQHSVSPTVSRTVKQIKVGKAAAKDIPETIASGIATKASAA